MEALVTSQSQTSGSEPDYGSGPHMALMAAAVRLARLDLQDPLYSAEAKRFLNSDIVELFADCLGYGGSFDGN